MFIHFNKATEPDGKTVRAVKLLDYSGKCEKPFDLPLRENLLWKSARLADLHGEFPDGEERFGRRHGRYGPAAFRHDDKWREEAIPPLDVSTIWRNGAESGEALVAQADLERVRLACGKCHWCANERKRRWERAATGWVENSPLTLFGTLTFSDEYFSSHFNAWIDDRLAAGEEMERTLSQFDGMAWFAFYSSMRTDRFDPANSEHDAFMRNALMDERQKMLKRLRHALGHDPRFEGVELKAHLSIYEYGDTRGRLHMHFLMHFDIGETPVGSAYSRLRRFLKKHWHGYGIGFVDVQHATPVEGVESAKYMMQYLLKYEEEHNRKRVTKSRSRLAVSFGYRVKGTDFYFAARPPIVPGGSLRPADPVPPAERDGFPASAGADADADALYLSEASQKLSFAEMPYDFRVLAEEIAKANLAWRDGELWPGWSAGHERPENEWAEIPDDAWNFAAWLLSRKWEKQQRFEQYPNEPPWEEPGGVTGLDEVQSGGSRATVARNPADGSVYDPQTGEVVDDDPPF